MTIQPHKHFNNFHCVQCGRVTEEAGSQYCSKCSMPGLKEAANWLRRNANAEKEPKARAALIEAHNAILQLAEAGQ